MPPSALSLTHDNDTERFGDKLRHTQIAMRHTFLSKPHATKFVVAENLVEFALKFWIAEPKTMVHPAESQHGGDYKFPWECSFGYCMQSR